MSQNIIDTHTHPLVHPSQRSVVADHTADAYRKLAEPAGITRAAALVMAPQGDLETTTALNDAVLELAHNSNGYFFPVCSVHPFDGAEAFAELARVGERGARWLKLHPNTQAFDVADSRVADLVGKAADLGMPVLFDAYAPWDANQPGKFVQLAMAVPEARLILAHAHGPSFAQLLVYPVLQRYPWWNRRVWIDISFMGPLLASGPFAEQFAWVLRQVGLDRVLFGSDYPMDDPAQAISGVSNLGLAPDELDAVFHDNAAALLADAP